MGFAQQLLSRCLYTIYYDLEEDKDEDFQTVALDDNHWTTDEIQIDICVYMNIHYHITYVLTHGHTWIILLPHIRTHWILVTFQTLKM